jgi:N-acetylglucosaminyl-diphospho-decaprenol L-rhamnosyltransferase
MRAGRMSRRVVARPICNDNPRSAIDEVLLLRCRVLPMTPTVPPSEVIAGDDGGDIARTVATRLSLITVSYGSAALVERLADAVWACGSPPLELVVVDNASPDGSVERLRGREDIVLVASEHNLGFGQGCMLGAERARGDLLMFLNPDITPLDDIFETLVANFLAAPSVAISFPKVVAPGVPADRQRKLEDVSSSGGAAMLMSRGHLERVGGFDARIFLYYEETDLCWRTRLLGERVVQDWEAWILHDYHGTGGGPRWAAEQVKNGLLVHIRLRRASAVARFAAWMLVKSAVRGVQFRDRAILEAWLVTLRRLPGLLVERRTLLGTAGPRARAELEAQCRLNARWQWYWRRQLLVARLRGSRDRWLHRNA